MKSTRLFRKPAIMGLKEAMADIEDGITIAVGGFGYAGVPFELLAELNRLKRKELTLIMASMSGEDCGIGPLVRDGQLKKAVTSYMGENRVFGDCFTAGKFDVELCPMGSLASRLESGGTGICGFYTTTGYGTAVSEGKVPQRFAADGSGDVEVYSAPRETRLVDGKWCVFETALHADVALVRARRADRRGNLMFHGTARNMNIAAAKAGKLCIAQVEEVIECGELDPDEIHMSGAYVDRLVVVPDALNKFEFLVTREESHHQKENHNDAKHRIARRAALEVQDGMVINLGIGAPTLVTPYVKPNTDVLLMAGNGLLGVGPFPNTEKEADPDILNASKQTVTVDRDGGAKFMDLVESMGFVRGGLVDMAIMGTMEVGDNGDLANWMVPGGRFSGMGGGMELVQSGCRVLILTTHTNKDGSPKILRRCRCPITAAGVVDKIITELAVFDVVKPGNGLNYLVLTELADGVTVEEVKAKTEGEFRISPDLCPMKQAPVPEGA
ncbi:putative mitochondrial succinyl-coa:3-ketoacid-coenzyme a transferase- like protein [Leptomonas pyrrhocoris]|uniref:Succinyl-CoA:3-ketoacid-coenzyme A transferase n=1 Tax=Leptomonas pyrrhocoris TaxID=157538 RepID=A0A0N0DXP5_LEPPY|nr:putative mitochondrial succinyl-coa:3-ketoacid-coenzyme a transferase- like protein [Leptomonas pyrrhocoris]KPA83225.1 putative mitochondrial succinyl-coa:3-ketoacid-coenzyme a transferase- like protein [Leptomonas pyrrhocoris]|eukprot:XP_015661664.1 putative mitochondrial succinyl-coa:3-ketoacid-coenzyme a transferase- like protein [Leptomonas pyrrhocoris]